MPKPHSIVALTLAIMLLSPLVGTPAQARPEKPPGEHATVADGTGGPAALADGIGERTVLARRADERAALTDSTSLLAGPVAARISYQGQLTDAAGAPLSGSHNLVFQLWDDQAAGSQVGSDIVKNGVTVVDGLFSLTLDAPADSINGRALWLQIGVDGVWLTPRQELVPVPYALSLRPGARIEGDSAAPITSIVNHGLGTALDVQGSAVGLAAAGMTGVKGEGDVGVAGTGFVGVKGTSETGHGVEGHSDPSSGVYGESLSGYGVEGKSQLDYGVYGQSGGGFAAGVGGTGATGVFGSGAIVGVSGYTEQEDSVGVMGNAKGNGGKGVVGTATGYSGIGLEAEAQFGTGVVAKGETGLKATSSVGVGVVAEGPTGITAHGSVADGLSATSNGSFETAAVRGEAEGKGDGGRFTSIEGVGVFAKGWEGIHGECAQVVAGQVAQTPPGPASRESRLDRPDEITADGCVGIHGQGDTALKGDGRFIGVGGTGGTVGVIGSSPSGHGLQAHSSGQWLTGAALFAENDSANQGMAAHLKNASSYHTAEVENTASGGVLYLKNNGDDTGAGGGDFITAVSKNAEWQFRVTSSGQALSDVGFATPAEDFAEMVPAVSGLEPGDVLVIGPDARLARASGPYLSNVAGVYSTAPGFLGGQPVAGAPAGTVPLAIVGFVPVKVTAENGPIRPGDLLVTAPTPGHAMRAGPNPPAGTVIGKAMGRLDGGSGVIRMLASLQ